MVPPLVSLAESMSRRAGKACVDVSLLHGLDLVVVVDVDPELHHSTPRSNGPRYIVSPPLNCDSTTGFLKINFDFQHTCSISKSHFPRGAILASLLVSCKSYCRLCVEEVSWKRARLTSKHAACTDNTCVMMYTNGQGGPLWPTFR